MVKNFFGITDKGKRRDKNEDTFIVQELPNKEYILACVIDGVGGYSGGDIAAAIARTVILEKLENVNTNIIETLKEAVVIANARIREQKKKDPANEQMACVLTCALTHIKNNKLYYVHLGDTRLYLLRDHTLVKLSKDHSSVGFLEDTGRLSEEDAMMHPRRNEINKALGFEENIGAIRDFIESGESPFLPGDSILLCSDGLTDMINSATIMSVLEKTNGIEEKARELVNKANEAGGNDNITAVLVENHQQPNIQVPLKPPGQRNGNLVSPAPVNDIQTFKKNPKTGKRQRQVGFLALCLLGALTVLLFQQSTGLKKINPIPRAVKEEVKNEHAEQLERYTADTSKVYQLAEGMPAIYLSKAVKIGKDSFYLSGNGAMLMPDSNYQGPAMIIHKNARHIILDSVVFKNFEGAIVVQNNNLILKNVRFVNCQAPIVYQLTLDDSLVSGRINDSIFIKGKALNNFK